MLFHRTDHNITKMSQDYWDNSSTNWLRELESDQHYESPYHYSFHYLIQFVVWNISSSSTLLGQMESTCSLHIYYESARIELGTKITTPIEVILVSIYVQQGPTLSHLHKFSSVLPSALSVKVSPNSDSFKYTFLYKCSVLPKISCPTIRRPRNKNSNFLIIQFITTEPKRRSH